MKNSCYILLSLFTIIFTDSKAQRIATLEVDVSKRSNELAEPARLNLDGITFLSDSQLQLVEVQGNKRTEVSFQIEEGIQRTLYWIVTPGDGKTKKRVYELLKGAASAKEPDMQLRKEDGGLVITSGKRKLLRYQFETMYPPAGIDSAYKRSGFIHPLWSPHGQVLTRIQPPDHYHHFGIWNPWTHVLFEGDTVDFWNIRSRKGTVRFANFTSTTNGNVFSEYSVLHEHVAFKNGKEKIALNEIQTVRIYQPNNPDYYIADITITLNCAGSSDVLLLEYRYGGLGWRTTEQWDNKNSTVLTSEEKTRKDADGSTARWCIVQGKVDNDHAGAVMMSHPANHNHPEPLRIWPENQYDRGDMFANFSPTKNKDWLLKSGQNYTLKYRLLVFNGNFTKEKAEIAWQAYSQPLKITVKTN